MRRSGKRCTALAATAALVVAALPAAPAAAGGPERGRWWAFVDRRAAEVDPLWRPSVGSYRTRDGRYGTRVAASMLAVHASAAVAGHVGPARRDDRIAPLVEILTRYPAFVEHVGRDRDDQFHDPGWTGNATRYPSDQHVAIDGQVAESLALAWQARDVAGLPEEARERIRHTVGATAWSPFFRWPAIRQNQFSWPADLYGADAIVNGRATLLRHDFRRQLERFLAHVRTPFRDGTTNLNRGLGFHYLPYFWPTSVTNRVSTSEYANATFHGLDELAPALAAGMAPLSRPQLAVLRAWARRLLYGEWTHAGYLNWDTGLGYDRWHLTRYWALALGGLSTLGEAPILPEREREWARWMLGRALDLYERYQADEPRPAMPTTLFGISNREAKPLADPEFIASRFAVTVAQRAADGIETSTARRPPPLYAYDPDIRRLAVTTPAYSAAVVDQTFAGRYGGADLARLYDGDGRPLGSIGSRGAIGFGLRVYAPSGRLLADTQPGRRAARSMRGPRHLRRPFRTAQLAATVRGRRRAVVRLTHRFTADRISTTYRVSGPRRATVRLQLPVWARVEAARRPAVTRRRDGLAVRVEQSAGGYAARVRAPGPTHTLWTRVRRPSRSSPGTAGVLTVVVRMPRGHATVRVALTPHT
jgi:hypothetical protein